MDTLHKELDWSYPTSDNAKRFGFYKAGCWTVSTAKAGNPPKAVAGFADKAEAIAFANAMPQAWGSLWKRYANA